MEWKKPFEITANVRCSFCGVKFTLTRKSVKNGRGIESKGEVLRNIQMKGQAEGYKECFLKARKPTINIEDYVVKVIKK